MIFKNITSHIILLAVLINSIFQPFFAYGLVPSDISNQIFHLDTQDINGNGITTDEPNDNDLISQLIDKANSNTGSQIDIAKQAIYKKHGINSKASLLFDGTDDLYTITDNIDINSGIGYNQKSFSMVFTTSSDITTIQSIYEQGASDKGFGLQINNGNLYAGVWNNIDWSAGHEYKIIDMGALTTNTTYNVIINYDGLTKNTIEAYLNGNLINTLTNVEAQVTHGECTIPGGFDCYTFPTAGTIGLGATFNDTLKMDDNISITGEQINHFNGQIGEILSWNQFLTPLEVDGLYEYHNARWYIENPSTIPNGVFHFDAMDIDGDNDFSDYPIAGSNISPWIDKFNGYNATAGVAATYEIDSIKSQSGAVFNGTSYLNIGNQNDINTATFNQKSFAIIFKTGPDVTTFQNIYEQGGGTKGFAIQIESGNVYAGGWYNGGWGSKSVSANILPNTEYRLVMVYDATDTILTNNTIEVFLDGISAGTINDMDVQPSHGGDVNIGYSGAARKLSDNSSIGAGFNFTGNIGEFISWNHALTNNEVDGINEYLYNKWLVQEVDLAPTITFLDPSEIGIINPGNFDIEIQYDDGYFGAQIDTSTDNLELYKWNGATWGADISGTLVDFPNKNVDTFEATYPVIGITDGKYRLIYEISNLNGKMGNKEILFNVGELAPNNISNIIYHYDAQDTDGNLILFDEGNNNGDFIGTLTDKVNGFNAYQTTAGLIPSYETNSINGLPSMKFDGADDYYNIDNQGIINTNSTFDKKSFAIVFKTGNDVNTFQSVYEQGGGVRGYSFVIHNGHVYAGTWNSNEWDAGHQYKSVDMGVAAPNKVYFAMIVQDSVSGNPSLGTNKIYLNGNLADVVTHVEEQYSHPGAIAIGAVINDTVRASDNTVINGDGYYFSGNIGELISWNHALDIAEVNGIQEYFSNKWGIVLFYEKYPIPTPTSVKNPTYEFVSSSTGSLSYSGSCNSTTNTATIGDNTINFDIDGLGGELPDGLYDDCTITLTDGNGYDHVLNVNPFEVVSSSIFLTEITPVITPSNNHFPTYTFSSPIAGTINYYGGCTSNDSTAVIGNNTITMNYLTAGTYNTCYINVTNGVDTSETLNITEFIILDDGPILDSKSIVDDRLYPIGNFNFDFAYHDTGGTGIDLTSEIIELYKWNGSSWGSDISATYLTNTLLTQTGASYTASSIPFGKYRNVFKISSNAGVEITEETVFYVDDIEFTVSTGSIDMGNLSKTSETFSPEINFTIKTVGAGFNLIMNKTQAMINHNSDEIIDYDGSEGVGYDQNPYSLSITPISVNKNIGAQANILNTNGDKNTYNYSIKIGTDITEQQAAGIYETRLRFGIQLDY